MPQEFNPQLIDQLAAHFPRRNEPNYAWGNAVSGILSISGLRGLWAAMTDEDGKCYDLSGQGRVMTPKAAMAMASPSQISLTPSMYFLRAFSQYLRRLTEPDIELQSSFTVWTWFRTDANSNGVNTGFISKCGAVGNYGWALYKDATDHIVFMGSDDGTNITTVTETAPYIYETAHWIFVAGRHTPTAEMKLWTGKGEDGSLHDYTNVAAIPVSFFNSTQPFEAGRHSASNYLSGDLSFWGMAARILNDVEIFNLFHQTRPLFMW